MFPGEIHTESLDPCTRLPRENLSYLPGKKHGYVDEIFFIFSFPETATGVWERAWHEQNQ